MDTNAWTHPKTGRVRYYIDGADVEALLGGKTPTYGHTYSGADLDRIKYAKYWLDEGDNLHIEHLTERGRVDEAEIRAVIEAHLTEEQADAETAEAAPIETEADEAVEQIASDDPLVLAAAATQEVRDLMKRADEVRAVRDAHIMDAIVVRGHSGYQVALQTGLTEQAVARIRKRSRLNIIGEQLRGWLAEQGITDIPLSDTVRVMTVPIISRATKRELAEAMSPQKRQLKLEAAEAYGENLDERDHGSVRIAKAETSRGWGPGDYDKWLLEKARDIPDGYDIGS